MGWAVGLGVGLLVACDAPCDDIVELGLLESVRRVDVLFVLDGALPSENEALRTGIAPMIERLLWQTAPPSNSVKQRSRCS